MSSMMQRRRMLIASAIAGSGIDVTTLPITYTGNMTDEIVTMGDGKQYRLLTLTSSGTLTIAQPVVADIWLCGGGANGVRGYKNYGGRGGSGGFIESLVKYTIPGAVPLVATIGAATAQTALAGESPILSANGAYPSDSYPYPTSYGASGGGGAGGNSNRSGLAGTGETTYPFGDTVYFNGKPHCAGGGGGAFRDESGSETERAKGGDGGSNGSNGKPGRAASTGGSASASTGGLLGGGDGGSDPVTSGSNGKPGTFYGAGGGGGPGRDTGGKAAGSGYQGVIYVRIPLDQRAA